MARDDCEEYNDEFVLFTPETLKEMQFIECYLKENEDTGIFI